MKNLFIILFLLLTLNLSSQVRPKFEEYTQSNSEYSLKLYDSIIYMIADTACMLSPYNGSDTTKVIFLLCDTTMVEDRWSKYIPTNQTDLIWWEYGYKVEYYSNFNWEVEFLDSKKQRFNNDILIWDYREL